MLLYNVNYRDAKTGRALRDQDIATPLPRSQGRTRGLLRIARASTGRKTNPYSGFDGPGADCWCGEAKLAHPNPENDE